MRLIFLLFFFFINFLVLAKEERKLFRIYIKPNVPMRRISDQLIELSPKGFIALALEVNPTTRDEFYIYTKEGKAKYIVHSEDITEIEEDLDITIKDNANLVYPEPSLFRTTDKFFNFESEFSFHLDQLDLSGINDFTQSNISNISSSRYKINTHFISKSFINFGANLNFQSTSWRDQNQISSDLNIFSLGPEIKFKILNQDDYSLGIITSYEFCPSYTINSSSEQNTFSSYIWDIGIINEFQTRIGKINAGIDFRKHYLTFNSTSKINLGLQPTEYIISSIGLNVGYKFEWDL